MGRHAGVPVCDLHGNSRRFPVQLFRFVFESHRKFRRAAGVSGGFGRAEHRARPLVRPRPEPRRDRRGGGDGGRPVPFGRRNRCLHARAIPAGARDWKAQRPAAGARARGAVLLHADLRSAVGDEPRHPDGSGTGEQLRPHRDGGLRRRREDRRVRLHAGAGLRQRLFHLYRAELWREAAGSDSRRAEERRAHGDDFLRDCVRAGLRLRRAAYAAFCGRGGDRGHSGGRALPAH